MTAEGSSADYGELRLRLGIDGLIVSPQHIFVHPKHADGAKPLFREQYWRYGSGPEAAKMLIAMMDKALAAYRKAQTVYEQVEQKWDVGLDRTFKDIQTRVSDLIRSVR